MRNGRLTSAPIIHKAFVRDQMQDWVNLAVVSGMSAYSFAEVYEGCYNGAGERGFTPGDRAAPEPASTTRGAQQVVFSPAACRRKQLEVG